MRINDSIALFQALEATSLAIARNNNEHLCLLIAKLSACAENAPHLFFQISTTCSVFSKPNNIFYLLSALESSIKKNHFVTPTLIKLITEIIAHTDVTRCLFAFFEIMPSIQKTSLCLKKLAALAEKNEAVKNIVFSLFDLLLALPKNLLNAELKEAIAHGQIHLHQFLKEYISSAYHTEKLLKIENENTALWVIISFQPDNFSVIKRDIIAMINL